MDAQPGPHLSPDGRHRWDAAGQRWVPVEHPPAEQPAAVDPEATAVGGWGRPVPPMPGRSGSTFPGWRRPHDPGATPAPTPTAWTAAPPLSPWTPDPPPRPVAQPATLSTPAAAVAAIAVVGAIGLVIGAFLGWITASAQGISTSQSGINTPSGDGWFFVVVGVLVAGAAIASTTAPKPWLGVLIAAAALAAAGLTTYEFTDVHGHIVDARAVLGRDVGSYGAGLYLLALGSALAFAGGIAAAVRSRAA